MWRAQVEALERVGHRGGRGGPARPRDPASASRSRWTRRWTRSPSAIDELGGPAFVVGLSLGGYVAIRHAARHPEQVAGLVAASCSTRPHRVLLAGWSVGAHGIARLPDRGARLNQFFVDLALPPDGAADVGAGGFALDATNEVLREMSIATPAGGPGADRGAGVAGQRRVRPLPRRGAPVPGRVPGRAAGGRAAGDAPGEPGRSRRGSRACCSRRWTRSRRDRRSPPGVTSAAASERRSGR